MKQLLVLILLIVSITTSNAQYWQQEVNYTILVKLDDKSHVLRGSETIEYTNNSPNALNEIYMHLWPNAYRDEKSALAKQLYKNDEFLLHYGEDSLKGSIDSLNFTVNNSVVQWNYDSKHSDICIIKLAQPLLPGGKITIATPFKVTIPSGEISRLGHIGQSYQITQWYPKPAVYDKNGWNAIPYLNQGEFYSEYGSFDVSITLPENYVIGSTGDLQTESEQLFLDQLSSSTLKRLGDLVAKKSTGRTAFPPSSKNWKTVRYIQKDVHDFAWFADKRFEVLKSEVQLPHSKRMVTTWAMFVPHNAATWQHASEYLNDGTYYYSLWNGDYPYNQVTAVDGTISAGGGMEYPNVTVIGNASSKEELEVVIVHEVGHNWFYGILGSNERVHGWMDEGMNTLNEMRYIQTKYPNNTRLSDMVLNGRFHLNDLDHHDMGDISYRVIAQFGEDQPIETHSTDFSSANYGIIMYQKTGLIFFYLKDYLGEELFDKCMHTYFDEWKFKHPQPENLREVIERVSGKKLDWLFSDLIQTTNHIDYKLSKVKTSENGTRVTVKNVGQVDGPIEVNVIDNGKVIETAWTEPGKKKQTIELKSTNAKAVSIDINRDIPEMQRNNNNWHSNGLFKKFEPIKLEFLFGDKEQTKNNLFWTPIVAGNFYDKFMVGAAIHNLGIPLSKWQYLIAPMYSTGRKMVSGIAEVSYSCLPKKSIKLSRFGLSVKSFKMDSSSLIRAQQGSFLAISPYYMIKFGNRNNSPFSQTALIQGIAKYNQYSELNTDYVGGFASYSLGFKNPDHAAKVTLRTDYIRATDIEMARVHVTGSYKYRYARNRMTRYAELRVFAGNVYHINQLNSNASNYRYSFSLSGTDGAQDLFFEDYYFGRGLVDGIWSQQRAENMGGFKSTSYYGTTMNWMTSANLYVQLPIPKFNQIGLFADAGLFHNGVTTNTAINTGLAVRLGDVFGLYFPLWMSQQLDDSFGNSSYAEKIRFTLRLNIVNKGLKISELLN
jgi:hypothetical protein